MLTRSAWRLLAAIGQPVLATGLAAQPSYRPAFVLRDVGYQDRAHGDGTWSVEASSTRQQHSGYAGEMALYRAAELASRQGHAFVQVLRSEAIVGIGRANRGAEAVDLLVRFADSDAPPADCRQPSREPRRCYTAATALILDRLGPKVRADQPSDAAAPTPSNPTAADRVRATTVRLGFGSDGRVVRCVVVASDAPDALNTALCQRLEQLAPPKPASGGSFAADRLLRVLWRETDAGGYRAEVSPGGPAGTALPGARSVAVPMTSFASATRHDGRPDVAAKDDGMVVPQ